VLATGFQTSGKFFKGMEVIGRNGITADQHWDGIGGIGAYNTTAMHDFPNFFMLLGPNSVTGHTSALIAIEKWRRIFLFLHGGWTNGVGITAPSITHSGCYSLCLEAMHRV